MLWLIHAPELSANWKLAHERQTGRLTFRFFFAYYAIEG
jgi:hypothetical protein